MIRNWENWWYASKSSFGTWQHIHNESITSSLFKRVVMLSNGKVET